MMNSPGDAPGSSQQPQGLPPVDANNKADVVIAPDPWNDELAKRIVVGNFQKAEGFRNQNFDQRWTANDRVLHGIVQQAEWEGTGVPRASMGIKLEEQQLESLLPHLHEGIFQSSDGIFFECFPRPGTDPQQATANREFISAQLDEADVESVYDRVWRQMCHHGPGFLKVGWLHSVKERPVWVNTFVTVNGTVFGRNVTTRVQKTKRKTIKEVVNRPTLEAVSNRDLYVDPSLRTWNIQEAAFVIQRSLLSMDEILELGESDTSFDIPTAEELRQYLAQKKGPAKAAADGQRQQAAVYAGVTGQQQPPSVDPAKYQFEVLEQWTEDRLVTVLERGNIPGYPTIRNIANPYGFIPYLSCNYLDTLEQFYGKGLAELLEVEQMLQEGLIVAHIDETSLNIHGALVIQAGSVLNKTQLRTKPNQVIEAASTEAVKELKRSQVTQDWLMALNQSQLRAQQITGITDLVVQGAPSQPTSVGRTARGVAALSNAAFSRIQYLVGRIEQRLIIPMLDFIERLNAKYLDPQQPIQIIGPLGKFIQIDPNAVVSGRYKYELRAASRMAARQAMQQTFGELFQTIVLAQPNLLEQGTKTNFNAIMRDALDVMGWRSRGDWFVQMSPQEMQARQQQETNPIMLKGQIQQQRDDARYEAQNQRQQTQTGLNILQDLASKAFDGKPAAAIALGTALDASQAGDA